METPDLTGLGCGWLAREENDVFLGAGAGAGLLFIVVRCSCVFCGGGVGAGAGGGGLKTTPDLTGLGCGWWVTGLLTRADDVVGVGVGWLTTVVRGGGYPATIIACTPSGIHVCVHLLPPNVNVVLHKYYHLIG